MPTAKPPLIDRKRARSRNADSPRGTTARARDDHKLGPRMAAEDWERTFDAMEASIVILDSESRITRFNRAARDVVGIEADAQVGDRLGSGAWCGEPWLTAEETAELVRSTGTSTRDQVRDAKTGRTWEITAGPSRGPSEYDERVLLVVRDVTPLIELQESLHRVETMSSLGMLLAGVAHEVRNPLMSISANLDAFEAELAPDSEHSELISVLRTEVRRLAALMRGLLEYGRPTERATAGGMIDTVVTDAVTRCSELARQGAATIVTDVEPGICLRIDRARLTQVVENLVQNAVQHTPRGGTVTVSARRREEAEGTWVVLAVTDSGPGFAPNDIRNVFKPFFSRRPGGTGLGLAIAQRIVEEHEGAISAANRPEGGAVVTARFPLETDRETPGVEQRA